ncbi:hypothetical protein [Geomonas agri]|uniref:hypothetical protein n=1 Tax=Geomonas agri TaxID=2873702 RepID=UPI001CD447ED|nr:hypothetical protein [Geomonas agri]
MKPDIATLEDVHNAVAAFVAAAEVDSTLERRSGKKLAAAVAALLLNDTKDLKQAYTNGEKWWSVNAIKRKEGCTLENRNQKIEEFIRRSDAWARFNSNEQNRERAEQWLIDILRSETNNGA